MNAIGNAVSPVTCTSTHSQSPLQPGGDFSESLTVSLFKIYLQVLKLGNFMLKSALLAASEKLGDGAALGYVLQGIYLAAGWCLGTSTAFREGSDAQSGVPVQQHVTWAGVGNAHFKTQTHGIRKTGLGPSKPCRGFCCSLEFEGRPLLRGSWAVCFPQSPPHPNACSQPTSLA